MAELKTKRTQASVPAFLAGIGDGERRRDCRAVAQMMRRATQAAPRMWGPSIVGFGTYHYTYASGREGDWFLAGFAPRKNDLTLYLRCGTRRHAALLRKLGKHKTGKACLYIKRLADVDLKVLQQLIRESVTAARRLDT